MMDEEQEDPILDKARQLRQAGASIAEVEQYLASKGYKPTQEAPARPTMAADASAFRAPGASKEGDLPVLGRGLAANALSAAQGIPFLGGPIEAFEAKMGSLGSKFTDNPMDYEQSLAALRAETDPIPAPIKMAGQMLVGGRYLPKGATSTIPRAMATGAASGVANGLLQADLNVGADERLKDAAVGGSIGAVVPALIGGGIRGGEKLMKLGKLGKRVLDAPTIGETVEASKNAVSAADKALYGAAEQEAAAAGGTSPKIQALVQNPRFSGLVDEIRDARNFLGDPTDDASVLLQLHRELSQQQGPFVDRILGMKDAGRGAPLTETQSRILGKMKEMVRDAGSEIMPSFPTAVATHAERMGERGMMREGLKRGRGLVTGSLPTVKKLESTTPESALTWAGKLSPDDAEAALQGALSSGKEAGRGVLGNSLWAGSGGGLGFLTGGVPGAAIGAGTGAAVRVGARLNNLSPLVDALDQQAGNTVQNPLALENLLRMITLGTSAQPYK